MFDCRLPVVLAAMTGSTSSPACRRPPCSRYTATASRAPGLARAAAASASATCRSTAPTPTRRHCPPSSPCVSPILKYHLFASLTLSLVVVPQATLEAKLNTWGAGSSVATIGSATAAATSQVYTVVWSVDTQARQSRFDYFTHSDSAQRASPVALHPCSHKLPRISIFQSLILNS